MHPVLAGGGTGGGIGGSACVRMVPVGGGCMPPQGLERHRAPADAQAHLRVWQDIRAKVEVLVGQGWQR